MQFNGTSQYVSAPWASNLELPDSGATFSAWIKLNSSNIGQAGTWPILRKLFHSNDQNPYGVALYGQQYGPTDPIFLGALLGDGVNGVSNSLVSTKTPLAANVWIHCALVYTSSQIMLYVNGSLEASRVRTITLSWPNKDAGVMMGKFGGSFGAGAMDDLRIYRRALSATEIAALASGNRPPVTSSAPWASPNPTPLP